MTGHVPLARFAAWLAAERAAGLSPVPDACCLSTVGLDGHPNARFLALKAVDDGFVVAGPLGARKGLEMAADPRVALTFWWPATARQVRVQGTAERLPDDAADALFDARPRTARLASFVSRQGERLDDAAALEARLAEAAHELADRRVPRPADWGAVRVRPVRIEFLEFSTERLHARELYERDGGGWHSTRLQP